MGNYARHARAVLLLNSLPQTLTVQPECNQHRMTDQILEELVLTVKTYAVCRKAHGEIAQIWIDDHPVAVFDLTLPKLLEQMQQQGWQLNKAKASPLGIATLVSYHYKRLKSN